MTKPDAIEDLVHRAAGRERTAFDELVALYTPRIEALVRSKAGPQVLERVDVEDVVQETFATAFQHLDRLEWHGERAFFGWLASIAQNIVLNASQKARRAPLQLDRDVADGGTSPSRHLRREERFERLERALAALSADHRAVIQLARIDKLKIDDIARRMDRSPNAVKKLLARALTELKKSFGDTQSLRLPDRPLDVGGGES